VNQVCNLSNCFDISHYYYYYYYAVSKTSAEVYSTVIVLVLAIIGIAAVAIIYCVWKKRSITKYKIRRRKDSDLAKLADNDELEEMSNTRSYSLTNLSDAEGVTMEAGFEEDQNIEGDYQQENNTEEPEEKLDLAEDLETPPVVFHLSPQDLSIHP